MRVLLAGATGYIGAAVLKELLSQHHEVLALVRPGRTLALDWEPGVTRIDADITHDAEWDSSLPPVEAVISCLASRSGAPRDAREVEYEANCQLLDYAERVGARHFVLLSAHRQGFPLSVHVCLYLINYQSSIYEKGLLVLVN